MKRVYLVPNRCLGCEECIEACKREHGASAVNYMEWVDRIYPVQLMCNHCGDAVCERVCPVEAITRAEDGGVIINESICIGCSLCGVVCPFGIPRLDEDERVTVKCDQCADRVAQGKPPACVEACPMQALEFGDVADYEAEREEQTARMELDVALCLRRFIAKGAGD